MQFRTGERTAPHGRAKNEDALGHLVLPGPQGCWVVADGLGGHGGGEVAAQMAVAAILASFRSRPVVSHDNLARHLVAAQQAILTKQEQSPPLAFMRTTVVVLLADGQAAIWGHMGDSRLYRFRGGQVAFQTKDHSVPQALAAGGRIKPEEIRYHEDRSRLLRAMGEADSFRPDIMPAPSPLKAGDVFLLCSDGFWEYVLEREMEAELSQAAEPLAWLQGLEARLLSRARRYPGKKHDNYTGLAVFVEA